MTLTSSEPCFSNFEALAVQEFACLCQVLIKILLCTGYPVGSTAELALPSWHFQ